MRLSTFTPSMQDFSTIRTPVNKITHERSLSQPSLGFMFLALDLILGLQEDEIEDAITDTTYLMEQESIKGHDRGIDAIYINETEKPAPVVHLFNFKYTDKFKNTKGNLPADEIDKMLNLIRNIYDMNTDLETEVNASLYSKIKEIWRLWDEHTLSFKIHICANSYTGFEPLQAKRFERELFSDIEVVYHLLPDFVLALTKKGKQKVNARLKVIDLNLFLKSEGDIRALIADIDTRELLRIVVNDEEIRQQADIDEYSVLKKLDILEDAFEDNVRVYLKQRSKINQNIMKTALSDEAHRLFYFNNGITITCSRFSYVEGKRNPIIQLENLQVVNGSQTIHALFEAFKEDTSKFVRMDILCRIYETHNPDLSTNIAEYTNSQNPVTSRDIRANDFVQKKLEAELRALGFSYERKKAQYLGDPKDKKIDAEKAGQALLAFVSRMPAEAKDAKRIIFAEKYDDIFSDQVTGDLVVLAVSLFNEVERRKLLRKKEILETPLDYEKESFILHSSYYILYLLSEIADAKKIQKENSNFHQIVALYEDALSLIQQAIDEEKRELEGYKDNYVHRMFFKGNRPKLYLERYLKRYEEK